MCSVLASAIYFTPYGVERNRIKKTIVNVYELEGSVGMFSASNGKTDRLSDREISGLVEKFNAKADLCISEECKAKHNYVWLNEDMLRNTYKTTVNYTVKSGIVESNLLYSYYYPGRN